MYLSLNKEKYLKSHKEKINNSFNQLMVVGILTGVCSGL